MAPWLLGLMMAQAATGYHCAVNRNDTRRAKHAIRVCERRLAQRCRGQNRVLVPENNAGGSCLCMEQTLKTPNRVDLEEDLPVGKWLLFGV